MKDYFKNLQLFAAYGVYSYETILSVTENSKLDIISHLDILFHIVTIPNKTKYDLTTPPSGNIQKKNKLWGIFFGTFVIYTAKPNSQ